LRGVVGALEGLGGRGGVRRLFADAENALVAAVVEAEDASMMPLSAAGIWIVPVRIRQVPWDVVAVQLDAERAAERGDGAG